MGPHDPSGRVNAPAGNTEYFHCMAEADTLSTTEILKRVRRIEIRTRRLVTDAMAGAYHSSFRGQGMDFEEVREYAPGDDVRAIDWNVTARMDRPFIKVFREERELTIVLLVDVSASGVFGSGDRSKREMAAEIASVLAFSAIRNNDKIGLGLFTDSVEQWTPARKGRQHVLRVIREVLFYQPSGRGTGIAGALRFLNQVLRRRAVVFLLSDFLPSGLDGAEGDGAAERIRPALDEETLKVLGVAGRRHDLICISVNDPREFELPNVGIIVLEDAETGEVYTVDTAQAAVRERYLQNGLQRRERLQRELRQRGIDHLALTTDAHYETALFRFFEQRGTRR